MASVSSSPWMLNECCTLCAELTGHDTRYRVPGLPRRLLGPLFSRDGTNRGQSRIGVRVETTLTPKERRPRDAVASRGRSHSPTHPLTHSRPYGQIVMRPDGGLDGA